MDKKNILKYGVAIIFALTFFFTGAYSQGLFQETEIKEICGTLSDCFLFPAVLLGGVGAMSWIAGEGMFDIFSYGFHVAFQRLIQPQQRVEGYYEYKVSKEENRRGWLKHWFIIGMVFMALSVLFLFFYISA